MDDREPMLEDDHDLLNDETFGGEGGGKLRGFDFNNLVVLRVSSNPISYLGFANLPEFNWDEAGPPEDLFDFTQNNAAQFEVRVDFLILPACKQFRLHICLHILFAHFILFAHSELLPLSKTNPTDASWSSTFGLFVASYPKIREGSLHGSN